MNQSTALDALSALSQETRLDVFRLLVQEGPSGLAAGEIAKRLGVLQKHHVCTSRNPCARWPGSGCSGRAHDPLLCGL